MMASFCLDLLLSLHHMVQSILAFGASGTHGSHVCMGWLYSISKDGFVIVSTLLEYACMYLPLLIPSHHLNKLANWSYSKFENMIAKFSLPLCHGLLCHKTHQKPLRCAGPSWLGGQ